MEIQSENQKNYVKVKGTAWMLESLDEEQPKNSDKAESVCKKVEKMHNQNKKWKKITNDRFEGFSKKIEKAIEFKFRKENENFNEFEFESLRKTESTLGRSRLKDTPSKTFYEQRQEYETVIFSLKRKEKDFQNQVSKMQKLKDMTNICEQKKSFYDNCVDQYFDNYQRDINKTITKLAKSAIRTQPTEHRRI